MMRRGRGHPETSVHVAAQKLPSRRGSAWRRKSNRPPPKLPNGRLSGNNSTRRHPRPLVHKSVDAIRTAINGLPRSRCKKDPF